MTEETVIAHVDIVATELRKLRRLPGPLDEAKMLDAPVIVRGLGGERPDVALNRLLLVVRRNRDDEDLLAAIATMGGEGNAGETVQERLDDYALNQGVDSRTIRRRSDRGILKLARMILNESPWVDPRVFLVLKLREDEIEARVQFDVPRSIGIKLPTLEIDNVLADLTYAKALDTGEKVVYRTQKLKISSTGKTSIRMRIECRGEIPPTYIADVHARTEPWTIRTYHNVLGLLVLVTRTEL